MSASTIAKLKGKVSAALILEFIKETIDKNAEVDISRKEYPTKPYVKEHYGKDTSSLVEISGYINFLDTDGRTRGLFYCYRNYNVYENLEYYKNLGLEDMVKSEVTYLNLGCFGNSIKVMKSIVEHFGGWIDENDCDDKEYYPILKKEGDDNIILMTQAQLDEHFGKHVVVVDEIL